MIHSDLCLSSPEDHSRYDRQYAVWDKASKPLRVEMEKMVQGPAQDIFDELVVSFDLETQAAMRLAADKRSPLQKQMVSLACKQVLLRQSRAHRRLSPEKRAIFDALQKKLAELDSLKPCRCRWP